MTLTIGFALVMCFFALLIGLVMIASSALTAAQKRQYNKAKNEVKELKSSHWLDNYNS